MGRFTKFPRAGPSFSLQNISRRRFVGISAGAAGAALGSGLWTPAAGHDDREHDDRDGNDGRTARCPEPDPIPHINTFPPLLANGGFRFFFPGPVDGSPSATDPEPPPAKAGRDPSTIFNFSGVVGVADLNLTGTGTDTTLGTSAQYGFHTDMRFMAGKFVGTDGRLHQGAFAFI